MPQHFVKIEDLAASFDCHPAMIRCMTFFGLMPGPQLIEGEERWCCEEIAAWIAAGMPVVDEEQLERHQAELSFLTRHELAHLLSVSLTTLYRMELDGRLPPPVLRGHRMTRWSLEQIRDWIRAGCPVVDPEAHADQIGQCQN